MNTPDDVTTSYQAIVNDYKTGMGLKRLAIKYHHDWKTIRNILITNNIPIIPQDINLYKKHQIEIIKLYKSGVSGSQIATRLGMHKQAVYSCLKRHSINRRPAHIAHKRSDIDLSIMTNLNNETANYWFGFLFADGWISKTNNRIRCNLAIKDIGHLRQFARDLGLLALPTRYTNKSFNKTYEYCSIALNNKELKDFYVNNNWNELRNGKIIIPNELQVRHFLRGFCDGDGIVTRNKKYLRIGFCSQYSTIMSWIRTHLVSELGIPCNKIGKDNSIYAVFWSGSSAIKIAEYLYTNQTRCLKRKLDKIMPFLVTR